MNSAKGHIYITVTINGKKFAALVDSGAARNLCSEKVAKLVSGNELIKNYDTQQKLTGISGALRPVLCDISNTEIHLGNCVLTTDIVAIDGLAEDLILGTEFLDNYDMVIDFAEKRLYNAEVNVPLRSDRKLDRALMVQSVQEEIIEPGSANIQGQVFKDMLPDERTSGYFILEPNEEVWGQKEDTDIDWVIKIENGRCTLPVTNDMDSASFVIPAYTNLAKVTPVIYNINEVSETTEDRCETIVKLTKIHENENLTDDQKLKVEALLKEFNDVFAITRRDLSLVCTEMQHRINLTDTTPVRCKYRKVPLHLFKDLEEEVKSLLDANIIEYSDSDYSSPVILLKRNGKQRSIVDYR